MAWSGTPVASTAAITTMNGAGTTGVNTAANYRQSFIGAFVSPAPGGPFIWRSGVIATTFPSGGTTHTDLQVVPNGTPNSTVKVNPGNAVISRTGVSGGPYPVGFNTQTTLPLDNADPSNPRIDIVAIRLIDQAIDGAGALQGGYLYVINGTASATPVAPTVPGDYMAIASITRPANNSLIGGVGNGVITDVRKSSGVMGGVRNMLPGDLMTDVGSFHGEMTVTTAGTQRWWDATTQTWRGFRAITFSGVPTQLFSGTIASGASQTIWSLTIPDPGYPYFLTASATVAYTAPTSASIMNSFLTLDGTQVVYRSNATANVSLTQSGFVPPYTSGQLTGSHTLAFVANSSTIPPVDTKTVLAAGDIRHAASIALFAA